MKKGIIIGMVSLFAFTSAITEAATTNITEAQSITTTANRSVVFRSTQRLKTKDGREIYLYPNRSCKLWKNDKLVVECTYRLENGEVFLLGKNGNVIFKGSYRLSSDGHNISSLTICGITYYK